MFHPVGINLLSNASSLALGVLLAPVTWLFGPVATLNVAATLVPTLSALALFWLLLRWVRWAPAAFVGGLIYGFSPFALTALSISHLMTGALMLPPLIVACLDELLVRQERRPLRVGLVLGMLIVVQFFLGTELLTIMALSGAVGLVLLAAYGLATEGRALARRLPNAIRGLLAAIAVAVAGLAYPAWFALEGPAHLSGQLWGKAQSGSADSLTTYVTSVWARLPHSAVRALQIGAQSGGYVGRPLPASTYLGPGVLLVIAAGICVWRKDRRLWFFGAFALINFVLSISPHEGSIWVPWNVLANVPLIEDIIAGRFMVMTILCAAVAVAIVVDRTYHAVGRMADQSRMSVGSVAYVATVAGLAVALVAVGPLGEAESSVLPLAVQPVVVPRFFSPTTPNHPGRNSVVLAFPFPGESAGAVMIWQAIDGMGFAIAGGGGPEGIVARAGPEMAGYVALETDSFSFVWAEASASNDRAVRTALAGWGVTTIVIPAPNSVPLGEHGWAASVLGAVGLITGALGRQPAVVDHALVWTDVNSPTSSVVVTGAAFKRCAAMGASSASSLLAESRCILATARP